MGLSGIAGIGAVSAQGNGSGTGMSPNLVDTVASKFNLNKDEVQSVFDEARSEREAARDKDQSERLQKLVDEGVITGAQKAVIEAKIKELKSQRESNKDSMKALSDEERKSNMLEQRSNLEAWAKEQGIDLTKLQGILKIGGGSSGDGSNRLRRVAD